MQKILFPRRCLAAAQILPCIMLAGCDGIQSTLAPHGPSAAAIAQIGWVMYIGAALILMLVTGLALFAVLRAPGKRRSISERIFIIGGGLVFPIVTLTALLVYGVWLTGALRAGPALAPVRIEVTGNRWWWDVRYLDQSGTLLARSANEIHIPAGVPVAFEVTTADVIHSFWVPNLAGKIDLIPGHVNRIELKASRPGLFRGQCAEYCGTLHAFMAFMVVAHPPEDFDAWLAGQRRPAAPPASEAALRGRTAFVERCIQCHTVQGLGEAKQRGPDLTHVGSRLTLGAGVLENNHASLVRWIADSQRIKPGNAMPDFAHLEQQEIDDIATWLEGLQ